MSLIKRQEALVSRLERIYAEHFAGGSSGFMGHTIGLRSKAKRLHREEMIAAGYSAREALESAEQCDQVAYRNADFDACMGVQS